MTKLSILIPTTPDRRPFCIKLVKQFVQQLGRPTSTEDGVEISLYIWGDVEVIFFEDNKENSIGFKRNFLLSMAKGEYIAFIDSDDRIGANYFRRVLEGIELGVDCCSLKGIITEDGANPLVFEHSIRYSEYKTNPESMSVRYERFPNHLNAIRSDIAKKFKFPEINHGEDTSFATQIHNSGLIKTEYYIKEVIYFYDWMKK